MKTIAKLMLAGSALLAFSVQAAPSNFPNKPVRLVVPYVAGGGTDVMARQIARHVGDALGQPIVVENKPGASTTIAAADVAKAAPDGYTLLWGDTATFVVNPFLYKRLAYDPVKSFQPVITTLTSSLVLSVNSKLPIKDVKELVSYAKAHPGKLSYGSPGNGSPHHLFMEEFKKEAGNLDIVHVPYKGEGPLIQDLAAGTLDTAFSGLMVAMGQAKAGKVHMLAMSTPVRLKAEPQLRGISETGVPSFNKELWHGVAVPAGTPDAVVAKLNEAFRKALANPELIAWVDQFGSTKLKPSSPQEMSALMVEETKRSGPLVKSLGITLN